MKRFLIVLLVACISSGALATLDVRDRTPKQRIKSQQKYQVPWMPAQKKWVNLKILIDDEQGHHIITLLSPEQACSEMLPQKKDEALCYWEWQFRPRAERDIRDDEAIVRLGSYFVWITEQEYCDIVRGTHQISSLKLEMFCRQSWFEFFQEREGIPEALKIMVLPPY